MDFGGSHSTYFSSGGWAGSTIRLTDAVLSHLRLASIQELLNWVYAADCSIDDIASLAPVIFQLADEGDVLANEVLSKAASELAYACRTAIKKLGLSNQTFSLILGGGILQHNRFVVDFLIGKLAKRYSFESHILDKQPLFCALLYGLKKMNGVSSETKSICSRSLQDWQLRWKTL